LNNIAKYKAYKRLTQPVMDDLESFCCQNHSTLVTVDNKVDKDRMMMMEGRRQVYLYIMSNRLSPKQIDRDNLTED